MRIACILEGDYEDSEFQDPYQAFKDAGHQVVVIGLQAGNELKGKKGQVRTTSDKALSEVRPADFDALFIPGGYSPDRLRAHPEAVEFVRGFSNYDRPVLAICHGPQLLMSAQMVAGHKITAWKTVQDDLRHFAATVLDQEVVVDGKLVTSRQPSDLPAFIRESLRVLEGAPVESGAPST
jgi:protease I